MSSSFGSPFLDTTTMDRAHTDKTTQTPDKSNLGNKVYTTSKFLRMRYSRRRELRFLAPTPQARPERPESQQAGGRKDRRQSTRDETARPRPRTPRPTRSKPTRTKEAVSKKTQARRLSLDQRLFWTNDGITKKARTGRWRQPAGGGSAFARLPIAGHVAHGTCGIS